MCLPFKFVDHTHSDAIMNVTNRPNGKDLCKIFGSKVSIVPYVMPGFGLAQKINEVYSKNPNINCLILCLQPSLLSTLNASHSALLAQAWAQLDVFDLLRNSRFDPCDVDVILFSFM